MRLNLVLPDRLQPAEVTKADRLEVAMAAVVMVEEGVAMEALLLPAADDKFSSTMSVINILSLTTLSESMLTQRV